MLIKRHIFKTISWRFIGTIDTLLLSFVISGDLFIGFKITHFRINIKDDILLLA